MSKFWVFAYRNANDNHIIAATEEFSDESAPLRRLGSSFGTKAKKVPSNNKHKVITTTRSAFKMKFKEYPIETKSCLLSRQSSDFQNFSMAPLWSTAFIN
ncbi:hypothetical protein TNCT_96131 [Trichonephila clavata]|uniref:Uncharacterized protein n=1 Tax=Trichonephila clavata TaxID=2740835 RepID=A0A8X6FXJ2_TRICU|nr:hypothetical protein TNCT_96131 [Trichonephila clavata]